MRMLNAPAPVVVHDNVLVKQARQANSLTPAPARLFIRQRQSPARQPRKAVRVDFGWLHVPESTRTFGTRSGALPRSPIVPAGNYGGPVVSKAHPFGTTPAGRVLPTLGQPLDCLDGARSEQNAHAIQGPQIGPGDKETGRFALSLPYLCHI